MTTRECYRILGIPEGSGLKEVKRAYRRQAMKYHPDRNPSSSAAVQFKRVHSAYHHLVLVSNGKSPSPSRPIRQPASKKRQHPKKYGSKGQNAKAAPPPTPKEIKHRQFTQTRLETLWYVMPMAFVLLVILTFGYGGAGFISSAFVGILYSIVSGLYLRTLSTPKLRSLRASLEHHRIFKNPALIIVMCINFAIWLLIGGRTLVSMLYLMYGYSILAIAGPLIWKKISKSAGFTASLKGLAIVPSLMSILLIVNFTFTTRTTIELYDLQNYDNYSSIRHSPYSGLTLGNYYTNFNTYPRPWQVQMTVGEGVLGMKVIRSWEFVEY